MTLAFPYALIAPLIIGLAFLWRRQQQERIPFPNIEILRKIKPTLKVRLRTPLLGLLASLFILSLSLGAARPQLVQSNEVEKEARDLMLVIDISGSMKERDFSSGFQQIDRLEAVKLVVADFVAAREGDRIGLAAFGTQAFLQSPLTLDHNVVIELLNLLSIGVAGEGTAIGDGLGVALKTLQNISGKSKAIILLTDGSNNSGQVSPLQGASVARKLGIKIHTIGIGSKSHSQLRGRFGQPAEYDEQTLKAIAESTGGLFFNAEDLGGLKNVYSEIDRLEKRSDDRPNDIVVAEYYPQCLTAALALFLLYLLLSQTIFLKVPA